MSENEAKKEKMHELPYTEIVKSGTTRLASGERNVLLNQIK